MFSAHSGWRTPSIAFLEACIDEQLSYSLLPTSRQVIDDHGGVVLEFIGDASWPNRVVNSANPLRRMLPVSGSMVMSPVPFVMNPPDREI